MAKNSACFLGYAKNHDGDCYQVLNIKTLRVLITHDVIRMKIIYFAPYQVKQGPAVELINNDKKTTSKYGESVRKFIFVVNDSVNALTLV